MKIYDITDPEFREYGKILDIDTSEIVAVGQNLPMPEDGSAYDLSIPEFEDLAIAEEIELRVFGGIKTQTGYCRGKSKSLNALEWHKNSEVNIAVTEMLLLLGKVYDVEDGKYDSARVKAFRVPQGAAIEIYATTMHFCPINTQDSGFGCVVVLPVGTNAPLDKPSPDKLLFKTNKWIIAHQDNTALIDKGVCPGIYGTNYTF